MDAIDRYIQLIHEPELRAARREFLWRSVNPGGGAPIDPADRPRTREADVSAAEEGLGVALPPSYRKLVTTIDPIDQEYGLYWVWVEDLDTLGGDIVWAARQGHIPQFLIPVLGTDGGDEFCFDTRSVDARGEYPIVYFDHEIHCEDSTEFEVVANDLGAFLLRSGTAMSAFFLGRSWQEERPGE